MEKKLNSIELAMIFKSLGDENRLRIMNILSDGEKCACRLLEELNISQSTLSHHMKILCDSGLVSHRKVGKWMYYSINEEMTHELSHLLTLIDEKIEKLHIKSECDCC